MVLQLIVAVPLAPMGRIQLRYVVMASAVLCLGVAIPIGLSVDDADAPPALLIPVFAAGFFVMLWLCGLLVVVAVRLPFDLRRLWRAPEAVERRARRAADARKARARRAAEDAARRGVDSGLWWETLLGWLAAIVAIGGAITGVIATDIHWDHVGPPLEAALGWLDRNGWIVPLGVAVIFGPMVAFYAIDHVKKRRRGPRASIDARRKAQEHYERSFSVCPNCRSRSFDNTRGRCRFERCFESTLPSRNAPTKPASQPRPGNEARFPMTSNPESRWRRCADCGLQYARAGDCPACARSTT